MKKLLTGKPMLANVKEWAKAKIKYTGRNPCIAIIQVTHDSGSDIYVRNKIKDCHEVGICVQYISPAMLKNSVSESDLCGLIHQLNEDNCIDGIMVQLPLPANISPYVIMNAIAPKKDVDGFNPVNAGSLMQGGKCIESCTPSGIITLLRSCDIQISGKECVIVGRSCEVGKPLAVMMLQENATVTVAHSKTENLKEVTRRADILIVAMDKPKFITSEYIKEGAVVVDVGIHRDQEGKLCGDVDFDDVYDKVKAITPVPGGVGLTTRASLLYNMIKVSCYQNKEEE